MQRSRTISIMSGWAAIGVIVVAIGVTILWQTGLLALITVFVSALLGYVSIRMGFEVRPRDKRIIAGMVAGAFGILPFVAFMTLPLIWMLLGKLPLPPLTALFRR